jgi:hypothetical protein
MGLNKHLSLRPQCRRRERRLRGRLVERIRGEVSLFQAVAFTINSRNGACLSLAEIIMGISDLFPSADKSAMPAIGSIDDPEFASLYPVTWSLCTVPQDDLGKDRETSTLLFFADGGAWKVRLSERNHRLTLWGGGSTFSEALAGLESQLLKRPVPWRKDPPAKGNGR